MAPKGTFTILVDLWKEFGQLFSLDETSLSIGELYAILTNKEANGNKGSIVAIIKGTKANDVINVLNEIPVEKLNMVKEVTVDMAGNIILIAIKYSLKQKL